MIYHSMTASLIVVRIEGNERPAEKAAKVIEDNKEEQKRGADQ